MAEKCSNCGAELFGGQRFCRACGASTDPLSDEQATTRMMPPQPPAWSPSSAANTAPASGQNTSPVHTPPAGYQPPSAGYQPISPPPYPQTVPPYAPPQKRSPWGWIIAFIGIGLFVAIVFAVMMAARFGRRMATEMSTGRSGTVARTGEIELGESTADLVQNLGNETTLVKSFALDEGAGFTLRTTDGSVVVTGWDQPKAEVKVIKRGDRGQVFLSNNNSRSLSIRTGQTRGGDNMRFEIKLPRNLERIDIKTVNGSVKLSDIAGHTSIDGVNGQIELIGVSGVSKIKSVNGNIKSMLKEASDESMEFTTVGGNIDLTLSPDFDANLEASAVSGNISIDDKFGIQVQKDIVTQKARGEIGTGGQRLKITTVNGSIRLAK